MTVPSMHRIECTDSVPSHGSPRSGHRILVVDDEAHIRMLSAAVLKHSGYQVASAEDGETAWEALNTERYDLLITDNHMVKVSGVELLRRLHAARQALPVILATGSLPKDDFAREPWLFPTAILLKPYSGTELLSTVHQALQGNTLLNGRSPSQE